jgi:hypothetical protein
LGTFVFHWGCFYIYCLIFSFLDLPFSLCANAITYTSSTWKGVLANSVMLLFCFVFIPRYGLLLSKDTTHSLYTIHYNDSFQPASFPGIFYFSYAFSVLYEELVREKEPATANYHTTKGLI